jgi:hypothetical protein
MSGSIEAMIAARRPKARLSSTWTTRRLKLRGTTGLRAFRIANGRSGV